MAGSDSAFTDWLDRWQELGRFTGPRLRDEADRTDRLLALWDEPIPLGWPRDTVVKRLRDPTVRYTRGDLLTDRPPEHELEYQVLIDPGVVTSLGLPVVDAVNAVPLVKAPAGSRRSTNVEIDMLFLVEATAPRLHLIEAKTGANHTWYAVVELLRALKLFTAVESAATQQLFYEHRKTLSAPNMLPVTAFVLAPAYFYETTGQRKESVGPARRLIERLRGRGIDLLLADWQRQDRVITPYM